MTATPEGDDIKAELASLDSGVRDIRSKLAVEGIKRDERIAKSELAIRTAHATADTANHSASRASVIAGLGVVVGLLGIVVGGISIRQVHDANANRAQRTVAACFQANDQTARSIAAAEATSDNFIDLLAAAATKSTQPVDPVKLKAFVGESKAAQHKVIEANYPKRDCSPAGIARFYSPPARSTTTTGPRA